MNRSVSQQIEIPQLSTPPYAESSLQAGVLRKKLLQMKKKISQALEPELSKRVKQMIRHKYNRVLQKVEQARKDLQYKGYSLRNTSSEDFLRDKQQLSRFYKCLSDHLAELIPQILNEIAEKLSKKLSNASKSNLLAQTIVMYPSLMGSYMYKPTLKQILTPTVRTLHHLEQQMLQNYSQTRGSEGSLWVFMYLISAIFVHLFGKYITPYQKIVVAQIIKETFVITTIFVATSLEAAKVPERLLNDTISIWLSEMKQLVSSGAPSL